MNEFFLYLVKIKIIMIRWKFYNYYIWAKILSVRNFDSEGLDCQIWTLRIGSMFWNLDDARLRFGQIQEQLRFGSGFWSDAFVGYGFFVTARIFWRGQWLSGRVGSHCPHNRAVSTLNLLSAVTPNAHSAKLKVTLLLHQIIHQIYSYLLQYYPKIYLPKKHKQIYEQKFHN